MRYLLIGGQACIVYGAAEFSRDSDFVLLCSPTNMKRLRKALAMLKAERIYVPPLEEKYLQRGHACHFRCSAKGVKGLRIDVLARLRGCDNFAELWKRRKTVLLPSGLKVEVLGLRDLVQCKKTQRDKDWLMLRRLVENDIYLHRNHPTPDRIHWWLSEGHKAEQLIELAAQYPEAAKDVSKKRPLLKDALHRNKRRLEAHLRKEEMEERKRDQAYWAPLRKELETLRRKK